MSLEIEVRPEDRVALRRALHAEARLCPLGEEVESFGVVTDLSVHGLWVAVDATEPLGTELLIIFTPGDAFPEISLLASVARVDRHEGTEARMGMGLSFIDLTIDDQHLLEDALSGLPARPVRPSAPVIALVEHDPLEDEVEEILEDEDIDVIDESGLFAIVVDGGRDDDFVALDDAELELWHVG